MHKTCSICRFEERGEDNSSEIISDDTAIDDIVNALDNDIYFYTDAKENAFTEHDF